MNMLRCQRRSAQRVDKRKLQRKLMAETLDSRHLMASDVFPHHNFAISEDVNLDFKVAPLDALMVINALNRTGPVRLEPTNDSGLFLDVNLDGQLSPADALTVINRINRGGAETAFFGQLTLDATRNGTSLLDSNRALSVPVGTEFDLEAKWLDERSASNRTGVFAYYADILASNKDKFIPVVGESVQLVFNGEFNPTTSTLTLTANGNTVTMPILDALDPVKLRAKVQNLPTASNPGLGFGANSVRVVKQVINEERTGTPVQGRATMLITFVRDDLVLTDVPDIGVNSSALVPINDPLFGLSTFSSRVVPALNATNNNDGTIAPSEINTEAFFASIDPNSASYLDGDGNPAAPRQVYLGGRAGNYVPTATTGQSAVFVGAGGFHGIKNIRDEASDFSLTVDLSKSFEAYSIRVRAIAPTTSPVQFTVAPSDADGREVLFYDIAYDQPPLQGMDPNNFVQVTSLGSFTANFTAGEPAFGAVNDTSAVAEDATGGVVISVLANDNNPVDGSNRVDQLTIDAVVAQPASGTAALVGTTQIRYTPALNFFGNDSFTYRMRNASNQTSVGTVFVTVNPENDPPTATNKNRSTNRNQILTVTAAELLAGATAGPANESDQTLTVRNSGPSSQQNGIVSFNEVTNSITYTPPSGFAGNDLFTYIVSDGQSTNNSATGTVFVTVNATADPPIANDDGPLEVDQNSSQNLLAVTVNDTVNSANLSLGSQPNNGTISLGANNTINFVPATGFIGQTTFQYTLTNDGGTDSATVTVNVVVPVRPRANGDTATTPEEVNVDIPVASLLSNDLARAGATVELVQVNLNSLTSGSGTLSISNNTVTYQPALNFVGPATFTYNIRDTSGVIDSPAAATGTVTINVTQVNDPPIANADSKSTVEGTALPIPVSELLANDSPGPANEISQPLSITNVSPNSANQGTVTLSNGTVTYQPRTGFAGTDTFTYTLSDNQSQNSTATGTVTVTVTPTSNAPVAGTDTATADEDVQVTIAVSSLLANDRPGFPFDQTMSITGVQSSTGATVSLSGNNVLYRSPQDFNGTDSFTYTLRASGGLTTTGTVNVTVQPINDPPVANTDALSRPRNQTFTIAAADLLGNDRAGPANETGNLVITDARAITGVTRGQVTRNSDGTITYTPVANDTGTSDAFEYVVSDGSLTAVGRVNLTLTTFQPTTIAGSLFIDANDNGRRDAAEKALGGVQVRLKNAVTAATVDAVFSDADGDYEFTVNSAGNYVVEFDKPVGVEAPTTSIPVSITGQGGVASVDNVFALEGFSGELRRSTQTLDLLVSTYVAGNPGMVNQVTGTPGGLTIHLGADGTPLFYRTEGGFEGVQRITVSGNLNDSLLTLEIQLPNGTRQRARIDPKRLIPPIRNSDGTTTIRVLGGISAHNFVPVT
jgi:hypothetical protein